MTKPALLPPGASRLFQTYVNTFDELRQFYAVDYRSRTSLREFAARQASSRHPRQEVAAILQRQNSEWRASEATRSNLARLAEPESLVVVTGQQVGIFGGPLFTLYKALTCIKLAEQLSGDLGRHVIPVFWLAADDDDIAEVNRLVIQDRDNALDTFSCVFDTTERKPVAQVHFTENILNCHKALADAIQASEYKGEILAALQGAYAVGESLPGAFARWLHFLLGEWGLIIINPNDPKIRRLAGDLFRLEFEERSPSTAAVLEASAQLQQAGFDVQVPLRPGRFNAFYTDEYRYALELRSEEFVATNGSLRFSRNNFIRMVHEQPERFSPNVIMRPIMQDFLLPNLAYVAGPAEIAYFAQLRQAYAKFGVAMPAIFPRKSLTLLEKKVKRVLEKYQLLLLEMWDRPEELMNHVTRREAPEGLFEPVAAARDGLGKELDELKTRATALDPTLAGFIDKERGRIFHQLEVIEKKLLQAAKKQNEILQQQLLKASNSLYPNLKLQERELSYVPFLCKYGKELVRVIYDALALDDFGHQIVEL